MWIAQDLRYAIRALRKAPASTAVAFLSLALGIGATTTIFCLIDALVLRPLPVAHPEELVSLQTVGPADDSQAGLTLAMFQAIRQEQKFFSGLFLWDGGAMENFEANGELYAGSLDMVSGDYFSALKIRPAWGRLIGPADVNLQSASSAPVAVLDFRSWKARFHGDPRVVGKTIRVNGTPLNIIGVGPESFHGIQIDAAPEAIVPIGYSGTGKRFDAATRQFNVTGRLKPGVTIAQARAQLAALWPAVRAQAAPPSYQGAQLAQFLTRRLVVETAATGDSWTRKRMAQPLKILICLAALLLLIAALNLANLTVARAAAREQETGIRLALGAGTWRLTRQLLTEGILISSAGATAGLVFAVWAGRLLARTAWTGFVPFAIDPDPDVHGLAFTVILALLTGLLFGSAPAWRFRGNDPAGLLGRHTRSVRGGAGLIGRFLVTSQIALSLVLVVAAGLFVRSLQELNRVETGYSRDHVLVVQLFPRPGVGEISNRSVYYRELAQRLGRIPGVEFASYSQMGPAMSYEFKENVVSREGAASNAVFELAAPDLFDVLRMRVLEGRQFSWRDDGANKKVVIVSRSLAQTLFPAANAVGQHVRIGVAPEHQNLEIVGVVNSASLWMVQSHEPAAFYIPLLQEPEYDEPAVDIRASGDPTALSPAVRRILASMGKQYPLSMESLNHRLDRILVRERIIASLAAFFGPLALLLACIGLYGLMSYTVTRRTSEIGIRIALGARGSDMIRMVLTQAFLIAAAGIAVGVAAALGASRFAQGMLFGLPPNDPVTISLAAAVLLATTLAAGYLPARRAAAVDPIEALRRE